VDWWEEIEAQLKHRHARVYVPDVCVAEAFKVLAKKYYQDKWFRSSQDLVYWRTQLRNRVSLPKDELRKAARHVAYHDLPSCRDIIVAVDRFYELFFRHAPNVSIPDLIVVAAAKYLMDFFDAPRQYLHIVTLDRQLHAGVKRIQELPNAYDPTLRSDSRAVVFE
jgi:hypothetical protein